MKLTNFKKILLGFGALTLIGGCKGQEGAAIQFSMSSFDLSSFIENFSSRSQISFPSFTHYKLNYELDGGTNSDDNVDNYSELTDFSYLKNAWKDGYMFAGWYLDPQFKVSVLDAPDNISGDLTIYAKWVEVPGFDVTGNEDGTIVKAYTGTDTEVVVPEGVVIINKDVFRGKSNITKITLPSTLTEIGSYCFYGCEGLTEVVIPDNVETIEDSAFCNCYSLKKVTLPKWSKTFGAFLFENCWALEEVTLGKYNEVFSRYMFANCHSLKTFNFHEEGKFWKIDENALSNCTGLVNLILPEYFQTIAFSGLDGCTGLTKVSFGSGMKYIGTYAFRSCTSLRKLWIPSNVFYIGPNAFIYCNNLTLYCELNQCDAPRYESGWNADRPVNWGATRPAD